MHNFRELVGRRHKGDPQVDEIVSELAGHLEETYLDLLRTGASEDQAFALVSAMGKNLGPTVRRLRWQREDGLRTWLRAVVLPGLVLSLFYGTCNAALGVYWEYASVWRETGLVLISVALGFCASSFSRELGGRTAHRVWAALAVVSLPAVAVFVMVFLVTPLEWVHNPPHYWPATMSGLASRLFWILLWDVVTPAVALVIGGVISIRAFSTTSPGLRKPKLA